MKNIVILVTLMFGSILNAQSSYNFKGTDYSLDRATDLSNVAYVVSFENTNTKNKAIELRDANGKIIALGDGGSNPTSFEDCAQHCNMSSATEFGLVCCWAGCFISGPIINPIEFEEFKKNESVNINGLNYCVNSSLNKNDQFVLVDYFSVIKNQDILNAVVGINNKSQTINSIGYKSELTSCQTPSFGCGSCHTCPTTAGAIACYLLCIAKCAPQLSVISSH